MTSSAEAKYCPKCGLESAPGQTICASCGTDLTVISDIMRGRYSPVAGIDDRIVGLLKDVYRGRRAAIVGGLVSIISLGKLAPVLLFGLGDVTLLTILLGPFLIAGLAVLAWGLIKWNNGSSEIRAIREVASAQLPSAAPRSSHGNLPSASIIRNSTGTIPDFAPPAPIESGGTTNAMEGDASHDESPNVTDDPRQQPIRPRTRN
jgi:hypothetical protein